MKIIFKNTKTPAEILQLRKAKADIITINYHSTMCFNASVGIPSALRAAREVCLYSGASILLHSKLDIEGDNYLSTLVIKDAELIGVSDSISNDMYTQGNALRTYKLCGMQLGVCVDNDVLFSGVDNLFYAGAKAIFHNTLKNLDKNFFAAYKSHMRLTQGLYIGLFGDCAVVGDEKFKIISDGECFEADFMTRECTHNRAFMKLSRG